MSEETEPDADRVTVVRGGLAFPWWTTVTIVESLDNAVSSFELELPGAFAAAAPGSLEPDDDVKIYVGDDLVITGVIDEVAIGGDATGTTVKVSGRSRTREIVDCSAPLGSWSGLTLLALARKLVAEYGLEVVDEAGVGSRVIRQHRTEEGETIFDALDRLGRDHAFLVTDDARGRVVLTTAGAAGAAGDKIVRGTAGFLSGDVSRSCAGRYSHIEVRGQSVSDLDVDVDVMGGAEDVGVGRYRRLIVRPERGMTRADAALRARWEATTRAAKALEASYELRGWRRADGALWRRNEVVEVLDGLGGLVGVELLAVEVRRTLTPEAGRMTSVALKPPKAYQPQPAKVAVGAYAYEALELETTDPAADLEIPEDE